MARVEELQAEIDALRVRLAACEEAAIAIADGLASYLEVVGVISRPALAAIMLSAAKGRRDKGDGNLVELDLLETAARRLFLPSDASVTASATALQ